MAANPIDTSISASKSGNLARREFNQKGDALREKSGTENQGRYLNQISGGGIHDKDAVLSRKPKSELGKDEFLKLMMAQIKNQDPLEPMDSKDMTAQMAQFSALEQLVNMNTKMDKMTNQKQDNMIQGSNLIGKRVNAMLNQLTVREGKASEINFKLPKDASNISVSVYDGASQLVRKLDVAQSKAGPQRVSWDGLDKNGVVMRDGDYTFVVDAAAPTGEKVPVDTKMGGIVTGLEWDKGRTLLIVDGKKVPLTDISMVESDGSVATPAGPAVQTPQVLTAGSEATPSASVAPTAAPSTTPGLTPSPMKVPETAANTTATTTSAPVSAPSAAQVAEVTEKIPASIDAIDAKGTLADRGLAFPFGR